MKQQHIVVSNQTLSPLTKDGTIEIVENAIFLQNMGNVPVYLFGGNLTINPSGAYSFGNPSNTDFEELITDVKFDKSDQWGDPSKPLKCRLEIVVKRPKRCNCSLCK